MRYLSPHMVQNSHQQQKKLSWFLSFQKYLFHDLFGVEIKFFCISLISENDLMSLTFFVRHHTTLLAPSSLWLPVITCKIELLVLCLTVRYFRESISSSDILVEQTSLLPMLQVTDLCKFLFDLSTPTWHQKANSNPSAFLALPFHNNYHQILLLVGYSSLSGSKLALFNN